ncbi:MAG: hypothetical protein ACRECQ_16185 [Burkholderiaceae bacterium]
MVGPRGARPMQRSLENSIELCAQELLAPAAPAGMVEVDDIGEVDPLLRTGSAVANAESAGTAPVQTEDSVEIELTAEQMDALLEGPLQF